MRKSGFNKEVGAKKETAQLVQDAIERKKTEYELRLTQFVLDRAGDAVFWVKPEGDIIYTNESAVVALGYSHERLLSKKINDIIPEKSWKEQWEKIKKYKFAIFESYYLKKNGEILPVEISANYIKFKGKEYSCIFTHDIARRREVNKKLKARTIELEMKNKNLRNTQRTMFSVLKDLKKERNISQKRANELKKFQQAVENASDYISIANSRGTIIYANKAAEGITGYERGEIIGQKLSSWTKQMGRENYSEMWNTINNDKKVFLGEIENQRKDKNKYIAEIHISPVIDQEEKVKFFVIIQRDITKAKEVDRAKSEFVSLASHQLRNPLAFVDWYTEMLLAGDAGVLNKDQKKYLEEIYDGTRRMIELVNALLDVSRIELGTFIVEPKKTDITKLADSAISELEPQLKEKKIKLRKNYNKKKLVLNVDPRLTSIIFQNLLSNAIKYTPEKGRIGIKISVQKSKSTKKIKKQEGDVLITVSDTGYGIPKSQQSKIFTKLFRAKNVKLKDTEGTGLGLYIVKSIIDHSKGKIWFKSKENKGTTFYIKIPLMGMEKKSGTKRIGN